MSIVVGIDPSLTSTGIAILQDGNPIATKTIGHKTRDGTSYAHRSDRIVSQCRAVIDTLQCNICSRNSTTNVALRDRSRIDLAIIEGPAYGANLPSNHDRAGLWWGLYSKLRALRIPTAVVAPQTRAKWATGAGNADKKLVLANVRQWWPDMHIPNHDIADALVLAAIGAHHLGDQLPFEIKTRHTLGLDAVAWPQVVA